MTISCSRHRARNKAYVAKRLGTAADGMEASDLERLRHSAVTFEGRPYEAKLRERYGAGIPLDESAISLAAIFASPFLVTAQRR
jgi:hypothetical protein